MGRAIPRAAHTPGPWKLQATRTVLGKCFTGEWKEVVSRVRGGSPGEADANTRLIAAAPELFGVVCGIACFETCDVCPICSGYPHREDCALIALISRAQGVA